MLINQKNDNRAAQPKHCSGKNGMSNTGITYFLVRHKRGSHVLHAQQQLMQYDFSRFNSNIKAKDRNDFGMAHKAMVTMILSENTAALLFIPSLCPQEHVFL